MGLRERERSMVVFGGNRDHFVSAFEFTRDALSDQHNIDVVQANSVEMDELIEDATVVIPFMVRMTEKLLNRATKLRMIMQFGIGLEGVDIPAATSRGIWVCNIPDSAACGNAQSCAEHALFLALSVLRDQKQMNYSLANNRIGWPTGKTLYRATALIYGYGGIGQQLSKRLAAFDTQLYAVTRTLPSSNHSLPYQENLTVLGSIDQFSNLAKDADIVFICCSQNSSNIGMVNKEFLSHLKPGAILINVARGGLLHYPDVLAALQSGHLGGVGIDVYHTEPFPSIASDAFLSHPHVIVTPHVAGVTHLSYHNMAQLTAANVKRIIAGIEPVGAVNSKELHNKSPP